MFAYARDVDDSIVLAAGIPVEWFDGDDVDGADGGEGLAIRGLRTPHGELGYSLRRKGNTLVLEVADGRSEEHTSELQSLMRISYAVFCLKKKKTNIYST